MRLASFIGLGLLLVAIVAVTPIAVSRGQASSQRAQTVDDPEKPDTFAGSYRIRSGQKSGKVLPVERFEGQLVRITEDSIVVLDLEESVLYSCSYKLKTTTQPIQLEMVATGGPASSLGDKAKGIIRHGTGEQKGLVLLCYDLLGESYPDDFRTRAQSEENLFVLEPIK